jgi:hypothetical protein
LKEEGMLRIGVDSMGVDSRMIPFTSNTKRKTKAYLASFIRDHKLFLIRVFIMQLLGQATSLKERK